jgi:hypothetical protein
MGASKPYADIIQKSARRIRELHARVDETHRKRNSPQGYESWSKAAAEFRNTHDDLAFPGGYEDGLRRIEQRDAEAIEAALVFVELRPWFFRSGFMHKKLLRRLKRVPLDVSQARRLAVVVDRALAWRLR